MDKVNSFFLFVAAIFYSLNIYRLIQDKDLKGFSPASICFFFVWNVWSSIYFNFGTDMFWSKIFSGLVVATNVVYLYYLFKFRGKGQKNGKNESRYNRISNVRR